MSAFKDAVAADVKNVFINIDEFAEEHDINGLIVKCVIDKNITAGNSFDTSGNPLEGVFTNTLTIYVASRDVPVFPVEGELLRVDGSLHIVRKVSNEMGVLEIVAEASGQ